MQAVNNAKNEWNDGKMARCSCIWMNSGTLSLRAVSFTYLRISLPSGKMRSWSAFRTLGVSLQTDAAISLNADLPGTSVLLVQPLELEIGPLEQFVKSLTFTLEGDP